MRATNYKHYNTADAEVKMQNKVSKSHKGLKALAVSAAVTISAVALIVPTTTLAPGVDAYSDSRAASYSVGDIDKFSAVITNNCVEVTTTPATEPAKETKKAKDASKSKTQKSAADNKAKSKKTNNGDESSKTEETKAQTESSQSDYSYSDSDFSASTGYSGGALVTGAAYDPNYTPTHVTLSAYDRAKTERLVMGEGGIMGYEGCALIAQSIRDAMVRSGTSSIDQIISEYQYFGSTAYEPNQDVKDAVSFIFDQDGVAIQHRVLCFYIGSSAWHETQTFLYQIGGVRFFDLTSA